MSKKNPIIYLGGPEYTLEHFSPILLEIQDHFQQITSALPGKNKNGEKVTVSLKVDDLNPEKVRAYAKRVQNSTSEYEIYLGGGIAHYLWTASRFLMTDFSFFKWIKSVSLNKQLKTKGRKEALSDFVFYILSYHVLLHELAHVHLGHCDFLKNNLKLAELNEFEGYKRKLSSKEVKIITAIEADADRQASDWLMGFLDTVMGQNGRGQDVVFPTKPAFYEFLVYSFSIGNVLNQQLTARLDPVHPLPNQRQYTVVSSIQSYLARFRPEEVEVISPKISLFTIDAALKTGLIGLQNANELIETAFSMNFVDDVIKDNGIRSYQHSFEQI